MRIACCPLRSRFKASRRFAGGTRKSLRLLALFNIRSLRRAVCGNALSPAPNQRAMSFALPTKRMRFMVSPYTNVRITAKPAPEERRHHAALTNPMASPAPGRFALNLPQQQSNQISIQKRQCFNASRIAREQRQHLRVVVDETLQSVFKRVGDLQPHMALIPIKLNMRT